MRKPAKSKARKTRRMRVDPWVGTWLREMRTAHSVQLADVAKRLRRDPSSVYRLESGDCAFPADDLPVILRAYGLTVDQFAERAMHEAA